MALETTQEEGLDPARGDAAPAGQAARRGGQQRVLVVGNEGESYAPMAGLPGLDIALAQSTSLMFRDPSAIGRELSTRLATKMPPNLDTCLVRF